MTVLKVVPDMDGRAINVIVAMDNGREVSFTVTSRIDLNDQITKYTQFCSEVSNLMDLVGNNTAMKKSL